MKFSRCDRGECSSFIPSGSPWAIGMIRCKAPAVILYDTATGSRELACFRHAIEALEAFCLVIQKTDERLEAELTGRGELLLKALRGFP